MTTNSDPWLTMLRAYERYAKGVPAPVRFDSFRRLVNQGHVVSKKVGRFREIETASLDAMIRLETLPFQESVSTRIAEALSEVGGVPEGQSFLLAVLPEDETVGCEPCLVGLGPEVPALQSNLPTWATTFECSELQAGTSAKIGNTKFNLRLGRWSVLAWSWDCPELVNKLDEAVGKAMMDRVLDTLVRDGHITCIDDGDERSYQSRNQHR